VVRGKKVFTAHSHSSAPKPPDLVEREFKANRPNQLSVADFTYMAT
jgi:putative transposase